MEWHSFWAKRLGGFASITPPPVFNTWVDAEKAALRTDYEGLKAILQSMLAE